MLSLCRTTMSEPTLADANQAARELRATLSAPTSALNVLAWMERGTVSLMVQIDPRLTGQIKIPEYFRGFKVNIRSKTSIRAF